MNDDGKKSSMKLNGQKRNTHLKLERKHQRSSHELVLFTQRINSFRAQFKHQNRTTNPGIVYSPILHTSRVRDMSVKIIISSALISKPINFTCNVSTTIEHLLSHAVCSMFDNLKDDSMENYMLKVTGKDEYLETNRCLADYAMVSRCLKFDQDVNLTLIKTSLVKRPYLRTSQDDFRCKSLLGPDDLLSRAAILKFSDLNYEALNIIIETFDRETERLYRDVGNRSMHLQTQSVIQSTKAICSLLLNCETGPLTDSKNNLIELCRSYKANGSVLMEQDHVTMIEVIQHAIKKLKESMRNLLALISRNLPVDYEVYEVPVTHSLVNPSNSNTSVASVSEQVSFKVQIISQLKPEWSTRYQDFHLGVCIMHGDNQICPTVTSSKVRIESSFFSRLLFDEEMVLPITYSSLPRESRFAITLYGTEVLPQINQSSNLLVVTEPEDLLPLRRTHSTSSITSTSLMYSTSPRDSNNLSHAIGKQAPIDPIQVPLAISMVYIFDHQSKLIQGERLLLMQLCEDESAEQIPYVETIPDRSSPVIVIEMKRFPTNMEVDFHHDIDEDVNQMDLWFFDFEDLNASTKSSLETVIYHKQCYERLQDHEKTLIWENRHYLIKIPAALPKFLLSIPSWSVTNIGHIYKLLDNWAPLEAVNAIQLLLPSFPDAHVRELAVKWISQQSDDELYDYLPQLLQAFRYEKHLDCPLFWMLLGRALTNVRIASLLYWQLKLNAQDKMAQERSETLINCLLWTCGAGFWKSIDKQEELLALLGRVTEEVKKARDHQKMSVLMKKLEPIQDILMDKKSTLPWAPSLEICDLDLKSCRYFPSNTLPLKLSFRSCEESCNKVIKFHTYDTIFKMGDDLRQDMLAIQMIRIMEKLWLREGLDLQMVTFDCVATAERQGMVEMIDNAETLRKIQRSCNFLSGAFQPKAIDNYIRLWNTSELEYKSALDRFLRSCAGYSVATYILGICDRHNDNIMVTTSGHLFHIDFGKFLGDAQMVGSIKRDRTPFVLTADMAYVINGGDRPSKKFQTFIELCTMGFNIIRRHRNLFLQLFSLMSSAKIHGLNRDSVRYIDKMLMPDLTETEAMSKFTRLIDECLNSRSAQVNFFIHNLAQLRFSEDNSKQTLLSFVPKTFTYQTDGQIESLEIVRLFKKYEPEKQYYYVVRVKRVNQPDSCEITRTFREFSELQMRLNCTFPLNDFHDINKSTGSLLMDIVGRNNTREVAERRLTELRTFLRRLFRSPPEVAHCDLVYTFFHPILRDQEGNTVTGDHSMINETSILGSNEYSAVQRNALYVGSNGQVKLSLSYKNSSLIIMIMHAKNLVCPDNLTGLNCYAKTYLLPDPRKQTKKKTRVVRQSCHPSFMELIVYNFTLDELRLLTLQVSIWHSELVQQKLFMGATLIPLGKMDLSKENTAWYPLKNF